MGTVGVVFGIGVLLGAGPSVAGSPGKPLDACGLLERSEVTEVQGARVVDTRANQREDGGVSLSQCFFVVSPFDRSVSFELARGSVSGRVLHERWQQAFHRSREVESEREHERAAESRDPDASGSRGSEPVPNLGDEAFWVVNPASGSLHVLSRDVSFRLSVGGPGGSDAKAEKCRKLAAAILARLNGERKAE